MAVINTRWDKPLATPVKKQEAKAPKKPEKKVVKEKPLVEEDLLIKKFLEEE